MRYYACESTPWAKVVRARLVSSWYQAAEGVGGDGGRDDGSVSRDSERRGERETYEKFPNELVHAEPRRQRVSSGSQLATVNTPWSRSSG